MLTTSKHSTAAFRAEVGLTFHLLIDFLRTPSVRLLHRTRRSLPVVALLTIVAIDIAVDIAINAALWMTVIAGHEPPTPVEMDWHDNFNIFSLLILAPIIEELQFRGWLNGRRRNLVLATLVVPPLYATYMLPPDQLAAAGLLALVALTLLIGGVVWWGRQPAGQETIPPWFDRHFGKILWGSAVAFGLIHVTLFDDFEWGLDLMYVVPQTVGAIFLTFTRLRLGLRAAMIHHALFNGYWSIQTLLLS